MKLSWRRVRGSMEGIHLALHVFVRATKALLFEAVQMSCNVTLLREMKLLVDAR